MSEEMKIQCKLHKKTENGVKVLTTWIPEDKAKLNNIVKIRETTDDEWEDGWKVVNTYQKRSSKEIHERSRDYLKHRKTTDI